MIADKTLLYPKKESFFLGINENVTRNFWFITKEKRVSLVLIISNEFENGNFLFELYMKKITFPFKIENAKTSDSQDIMYFKRQYKEKTDLENAIKIGMELLEQNKLYSSEIATSHIKRLPIEQVWSEIEFIVRND